MKYLYKTVNGITEIEVDERYHEILVAMDAEEEASNSRYIRPRHDRRRTVSLDGMDHEGEMFDDGTDILGGLVRSEMSGRLRTALAELTPAQQALVLRVYVKNERIIDIARENGVSAPAVRNRLRKIHEKLKKYLR
jgi:RNA polymerase sigma factor (sigma-70 family)